MMNILNQHCNIFHFIWLSLVIWVKSAQGLNTFSNEANVKGLLMSRQLYQTFEYLPFIYSNHYSLTHYASQTLNVDKNHKIHDV